VMPLLREDQRQPLQAMLDKALVATRASQPTPSTVAEISSATADASDAKANDSKASEVRPASRFTWGWLALLAAALALFVGGLMRARGDMARQLPEGA
jgi:hypothetical protein